MLSSFGRGHFFYVEFKKYKNCIQSLDMSSKVFHSYGYRNNHVFFFIHFNSV